VRQRIVRRISGVGVLLAVMVAMPATGRAAVADTAGVALVGASSPVGFVDNDFDGIDDALEQQLADRFAPVLLIESDESNYPVNVEWFLQRARLQYHEDCGVFDGGDVDDDVGPNPIATQDNLIGSPWLAHAHCGQDDTGYRHPPHRDITTIAADPDGQVSAGAATTGYSDQQTFLLPDLPDGDRVGSLNPADWKTYVHAYPTAGGGIMLQYWHLFAYNALAVLGIGNHGGDWDATIHVQLGPDLTVQRVWFSRHSHDHPGDPIGLDRLTLIGGTHTLMTIDGGGHAAYASPADFCANRSVAGGTAAWPTDLSDPLNPAKLAAVDCGGFPVIGPIFFADHPGGTVWQTWDGGSVVASGGLTHPIISPSGHGGMINLGEYNPCTPVTCYGSRQASTLLAGQFHPLNGQRFLRFEGRWGSLPHCAVVCPGADPPRGPAFQGAEDTGSEVIYQAWYNQGANTPASPATSPWRAPPTTTYALSDPHVTVGTTTYVSGGTTVSLTVSANRTATEFGATRTFYRSYPVGSTPPAFALYTGPFALPAPDGPNQIDFYSLDALNNTETVQSLRLTRDATAPTVTITAPAPGNYPHSATITAGFTADDGAGSAVATVRATLDGADTVAGQPLTSGMSIDLLTALGLGTHTLVVTATDRLGNTGQATVSFTIVVTPQSIKDDVSIFASRGDLASPQRTPLMAKLDAAAAARQRGDCTASSAIYQAFINEVNAQAGKDITTAAAAILTADAQYLIEHCP
jgi:hypothetical protein